MKATVHPMVVLVDVRMDALVEAIREIEIVVVVIMVVVIIVPDHQTVDLQLWILKNKEE